MVEFGAKLADNRNSEWVEHYIRYEKLKQILETLKTANNRYLELAEKDPERARLVENETRRTLPSSAISLENLKRPENEDGSSQTKEGTTTLKSSRSWDPIAKADLVGGSGSGEYGSLGDNVDQTITESGGISSVIARAASGVTDYFDAKKKYERQLRVMLNELDKVNFEFETCLLADIDRVNTFYNEKLTELQDRLKFLNETVEQSRIKKPVEAPKKDVEDPNHVQAKPGMFHSIALISMGLLGPKGEERKGLLDLTIAEEEDPLEMTSTTFKDKPSDKKKKAAHIREAESIQRALVDQYRTGKLLHNFAIMNYTGFVKIVKKHDKVNPEHKGKYKRVISPENVCNEGKAVEALEDRLELLYASWFCDGNRSEAMAQLLPKRGDSLEMDWSQLRLGYRMGMATILGLWVCWDCVWGLLSEHSSTIGARSAFPVFRACGGLLFLQWFWGMSVWVWSRYRVNYIYLFDMNPRIVQSPLSIFNAAVDNTLVFLLSMLLYYKAGVHDIPGKLPAGVFPILLVMYTLFQLVFPFRTRMPMWGNIWKVVTAPISSPSFFHGYIGDIFTSMVKVFQDIAWTIFFVFSGDWLVNEDLPAAGRHTWANTTYYRNILIPILTLFPLMIRFNQSLRRYADTGKRWPHIGNAAKYALSMSVTLFGAFHPLYLDKNRHRDTNWFQGFWMTTFIGSSLYSFWWDVNMDWGLGRLDYQFLGPRLMYPKRSMYYAIIVLDLVLRFAWVLTLIPPDTGARFALPHYLTAVSMILELYRRTVWGFLRLENEHRSNTAGFRRVGFVPLHFTTGHMHQYTQEKEQRGFKVLIEIAVITIFVLGACTVSVVAAQRATEKTTIPDL